MIKGSIFASLALAAALVGSNAHAVVVDLENNDEGSAGGGPTSERMAIFQFTDQQPTGTGKIDQPDNNVFLSIQANGSEQGYNSDAGNFDTKRDPRFNHEITFSDLQSTTVMLNGVSYYQILLDVNEPNGSKSIINLAELQIYTSQTIQRTNQISADGSPAFTGAILRYDLDFYGDSDVRIDAARNSGSGSGDVNIFIPVEAFAGTAPSDYVYLYALFTGTRMNPDGTTQGGFEEFALVNNITPIPELSSFFPIIGLMVAVGATSVLRRRKMAQQTTV